MYNKLKEKLHHFLNTPQQLFWFYIGMNLIPSICLTFTEPFTFMGKFLLILFPLGFYFILFSSIKNTGLLQLLLFPLLFLHAFQLVLFYLFGEAVIAVDMFLNIATTNVSEASELLDNIWPAVVLVCILYIPTTIIAAIACKHKVHTSRTFRRKMIFAGILLLLLTYGLTFYAQNKNTGKFTFKEDLYPTNIFYNLGFAFNKWHKSENYPETSKDFTFDAQKDIHPGKREIYILVVGEASRAENWSFNGYGRTTTPKLQSTQGLIYYPDAITQSNTTHKSVPLILSAASAENYGIIYSQKSILQAFKEAGFTTLFLSNQTPNRSFTDFYAAQANIHHNLRTADHSGLITANNYDETLLPLVRQYIDSLPGDLFFVLHTYGSHFNYKERYPKSFSHYTPDNATDVKVQNKSQLINAYDNSILYTDMFLNKLIQTLAEQDACTALFYTSDHGEDLLDDDRNRFLHSSPNPTFYQLHIPIFLWLSGNYQTAYPQKTEAAIENRLKPIATNSAFHTVLDMAAIRTKYLQPALSLVNPQFEIAPRMYLNDHDKPILFYKAGLKEEDMEMIKKRNLYIFQQE